MRLYELLQLDELQITKDIKKLDPRVDGSDENQETGYSLEDILKKHGWKTLGKGYEAAVAYNPQKDYVLKIYPSNSRYTKFVDFVKKNQNNQHLPKFGKYTKRIPGTNFSYITMEKLSKVTEDTLSNQFFSEIMSVYIISKRHNIGALAGNLKTIVEQFLEPLPEIDFNDNDSLNEIWRLVDKPDNEWNQIVEDVITLGTQMNLKNIDLGDENFMRRGNTLVILDPFI